MKFLHTADWQIGMKADSVGTAGPKVREERLRAGTRVIEVAQQNSVDFVLVAGDLFEDNAVERRLIQRTADILSGFDGPVYIIPGNHDPFIPGSVWDHPAWGFAGNLHILHEPEPAEGPGCTLYPCPLKEKYSSMNPTSWIKAGKNKGINIGIAHGTVEGIPVDEIDYPLPGDAAEKTGLDYLALGHWHSTTIYSSSDGAKRMAYSGTHEQSKFGERDSGNVLLVEIGEAGAAPIVTQIQTGKIIWENLAVAIHEPGDLARVRQNISEMDHPDHTLIRVDLSGLLQADEQQELAHIEDILASRFLYGRLDALNLRPSPGDDSWISSLSHGIVRETATRLLELASSGGGDGKEAEIASRALIELYAIMGKVSQ